MCCLRYEHEFYVQQRKRFPKEGKIITTLAGEEKVVSNDIFREQVTLRDAAGESRTIPLAALHRELGGEFVEHAVDLAPADDDDDEEHSALDAADLRRMPVRESEPAPRADRRPPRPEPPRPDARRPEQHRAQNLPLRARPPPPPSIPGPFLSVPSC
ncbi:MAG: hypothetical protein HYR75_08915, partial [Gemmatimonadetes bacterium]|nr:hypothetical protein [Gemmatimonadota bacterium]